MHTAHRPPPECQPSWRIGSRPQFQPMNRNDQWIIILRNHSHLDGLDEHWVSGVLVRLQDYTSCLNACVHIPLTKSTFGVATIQNGLRANQQHNVLNCRALGAPMSYARSRVLL
jgi:hypothetical protein